MAELDDFSAVPVNPAPVDPKVAQWMRQRLGQTPQPPVQVSQVPDQAAGLPDSTKTLPDSFKALPLPKDFASIGSAPAEGMAFSKDPNAELKQAQEAAKMKAGIATMAAIIQDAADKLGHRDPAAAAAAQAIYKRAADNSDQAVKDILQRRAASQQQFKEQQEQEASDVNSERSKRLTAQAKVLGLLPQDAPGLTAQDIGATHELMQTEAGKENAAANNKLAEANLNWQKQHGLTEMQNQQQQHADTLGFDREKLQAELNAREAERLEKERERQAQQGKLPAEAVEKMQKTKNAMDAVDRIQSLYEDARKNPTDLSKRNAYMKASQALAGTMAGGIYDKITAGDAKLLADQFPDPTLGAFSPNSGNTFFQTSREQIHQNRANVLGGLQAQGYHVPQEMGGAAPATQAPVQAPARPQRITRTDPKSGETRVWNGTAWVKE